VSLAGPREPIADEDWLLRRIPDQPEQMWTRKRGVLRPSSAALKPAGENRGMSVDVRRLLDDPSNPASALSDRQHDGLVEFQAAIPRQAGLDVAHTPLPERYSHADVLGFEKLAPAQSLRFRRELARQAAWVKLPASAVA
jgi:hypothetical protein